MFYNNNVPAYYVLIIGFFLVEKQIAELGHPSYWPDLAPCDFLGFRKTENYNQKDVDFLPYLQNTSSRNVSRNVL